MSHACQIRKGPGRRWETTGFGSKDGCDKELYAVLARLESAGMEIVAETNDTARMSNGVELRVSVVRGVPAHWVTIKEFLEDL